MTDTTGAATALHGTNAIRLVARREIVTRVRTRSFRVALLITMGAVVVGIVLPHALHQTPGPYRVEVVGPLSDPSREALHQAGAAVGRKIVLTNVVSASAARAEVRDGRADMVVVDGESLIIGRMPGKDDTSTFARFLATAASSLRVYAGLAASGLSPEEARTALSHPPLHVDAILPARVDRTSQKAITSVGIILLFIFIQQYGNWVINGVIEEKQSRVVEVLLSVIRPTELLIGKTIGIGVVALGNGAAIAVAALVASSAVGGSILSGGGTVLILGMVGWFVLGYALYCLLMAMAGSLVSRQEEAQNASFPFMMPLLVAYISSIGTVFSDTTPPFVKVLSFFPLTAPVSMPARLAQGPVPTIELVICIATMIATILVVARLAAVVYGRAVLHSGGRLRWKDVLRTDLR